jgi:hypothetical protein
MTIFNKTAGTMMLTILVSLTAAGCHKEEKTISYSQDVKPISGFDIESYDHLMAGTRNGPMIIAGDSLGSNMLVLMEGRADPSIKMPHGKPVGATQEELDTIRLWIDQGAQNN